MATFISHNKGHSIYWCMAFLASVLVFVGCSEDTIGSQVEPQVLQPHEILLGSWELESTHAAGESHFYDNDEMFWFFYPGGSVCAVAQSGSMAYECLFDGSYLAGESTLLVDGIEGGPLDCTYSFSADSDSLRLAYEFDVGPGWLSFIRVSDAPSDNVCDEAGEKPPGE